MAPDLATLRARLVALDAARADGRLDDAAYDAARRDVERALAEAVLAAPAAPFAGSADEAARAAPVDVVHARPSRGLLFGLAALVVAIAVGGYAATGSFTSIGRTPPPTADREPPSAGDREIGLKEIAAMVDGLAARLKDRPDDAEGWTMLARSYSVLTRYAEAVPAYEHATALRPRDAGLLADYADAIAAANGGRQDARSLALVERALAIDPVQPKALALAGTAAFDSGDFAKAAADWQKIADRLPPDSEFHKQVMANIDEARRRGGLPPSARAAATAAGREALTGIVTLAPSLAAKASPDDTVFVLARPVAGRMPLAVMRATVRDLPLAFRLDDAMAMTPTMKLSDMKEVVVVARVSKSGNASAQKGDLVAESAPVAPGTTGLSLVVANEVK